ncbi:MAG: helix-turn-helix transcriptional regulator [Lachnospiraceae bacterium]|nr:helix-turn-helix transcriptional regulator [Lachnospiraceae bacterium]
MNGTGDIICKMRQNKNMTQEEFASRLGVTPQAVSRWERGNSLPDISLIEGICKIINKQCVKLLIACLKEDYPGVVEGLVPEKISYLQVKKKLQEVLQKTGNIRDLIHILSYFKNRRIKRKFGLKTYLISKIWQNGLQLN